MKFDLNKRIFEKIEGLGSAQAAAYFGKTETTIKKWQAGTAIADVSAAQKVLDEAMDEGEANLPVFSQPPPQGKTIPDEGPKSPPKPPSEEIQGLEPETKPVDIIGIAKQAKKFHILLPTNRDFAPVTAMSIMGNWKATLPAEIQKLLASMDLEQDTLIHRARNLLAMRFLASEDEWSFWMDSDMVASFGNPTWFARKTNSQKFDPNLLSQAAIIRLSSRGQTFVGATYSERSYGSKVIAAPWFESTPDKALADKVKKGPRDEIVPVKWVGFGCAVVHRRVFEDILKKVPNVRSKKKEEPHDFFTAFEDGPKGEDTAFAKRAAEAGHKCFLDLGCFCGHIGRFAFMP